MEFSGIRGPDIVQTDSESTDVESKLYQMPTESSSDSNEECISDRQSSEQAVEEQNEEVIRENAVVREPVEHDETESKSAMT